MPILPTTPNNIFLGVAPKASKGPIILRPENPLLLTPTKELTEPWQDPPMSNRAISVDEMYVLTVEGDTEYDYDVGLTPNFAGLILTVENRTISNDLSVEFTLPAFLMMASSSLVVEKEKTVTAKVLFNEAEAKRRSIQTTRLFDEWVNVVVTPLLVTGPVYIKTSASV